MTEETSKTFIQYHSPELVKINSIKLDRVGFYDVLFEKNDLLKEIRIYTDKAKTRIYKPSIMTKLNKIIKETGKLELNFLPKRIQKSTCKLKVTFVLLEGN